MGRGKGADARLGTELAGYRIEGVLGRGGMSDVYLAEHLKLGRKVALKILDTELNEDDRFRERFIRESHLAASLEDPNVIPIYEAGEADGVLFIAMRWVRGTDLKALLREEGALPPDRAGSIVSQVASALDAAHARGLVHRDVKPANVLVVPPADPSKPEHVYLSDFGLTKRASSESGITGTGQFLGTLDYAAPEQFEGKPLDARTDIYSLGCVLYECLTGEVPYRKEQDAALMYAHLQEPPPRVTAARPELPPAIDGVVANAMAKRPEDRYASAGALAQAARRALAEAPAEAPAGARADGATDRAAAEAPPVGGPPAPPRRRRVLIGGLAVLVVAAVLAAVLLTQGGGTPRATHTPSGPAPSATAPSSSTGFPALSMIEVNPSTGKAVKTVPGALKGIPGPKALGGGVPIAVGEGGVWLVVGSSLVHVDETSGATRFISGRVSGFSFTCCGLAVGFRTVWLVGDTGNEVRRIDPFTQAQLKPIKLPSGVPTHVALGQGSAWVVTNDGFLYRIDGQTGRIQKRVRLGSGNIDAVVDGAGFVWVVDKVSGVVRKIDPTHPTAGTSIPVTGNVSAVAAGAGGLWILDEPSGTVSMIDPAVDRQSGVIRVGQDPASIAIGLGRVWVTDHTEDAVYRIDPLIREAAPIDVGAPVTGIAVDERLGRLWLEVVPKP